MGRRECEGAESRTLQDPSQERTQGTASRVPYGTAPKIHANSVPATEGSLTIEVLDALDIILMQLEVLHVAVHGVHQCLTHTGVVQPQRVPKLVGSHQEDAVTWKETASLVPGQMDTLLGTAAMQGPQHTGQYLCLGRSPTSCRCRSCWWWHTRASHPAGPDWCTCCRTAPGR